MFAHAKLWVALTAMVVGVLFLVNSGAIERAPGVLVAHEPLQKLVQRPAFQFGNYQLTPLAEFDVEARVLSVEKYRTDGGSRLSPIDFALGWGPMSDSAVLDHFRIKQGGRFFSIYPDEQAIDLNTALRSASNMHLIPASGTLEDQLKRVRPGNIVRLRGKLVSALGPNNFTWTSSLTRADSGNGACELFYVESMERR
ncbi:MAG: hypothetical protein ABW171_06050 [Steroidobacter sp.]